MHRNSNCEIVIFAKNSKIEIIAKIENIISKRRSKIDMTLVWVLN